MKNYFEIYEFLKSDTAISKGINNTASPEVIEHIMELRCLLNQIREEWGGPIRITSGYRCPELNKLVGGVPNSSHLTGYAADIIPVNGDKDTSVMQKFKSAVRQFFEERRNKLLWDQVILEKNKYTEWIHIGLKRNDGVQRCELFELTK